MEKVKRLSQFTDRYTFLVSDTNISRVLEYIGKDGEWPYLIVLIDSRYPGCIGEVWGCFTKDPEDVAYRLK